MKLIFNDGRELMIQSAGIQPDGSLLIKTISADENTLRVLFSDSFATAKLIVKEREAVVGEPYEKYTTFNAIVKYTAGIMGIILFKEGETAEEKLSAVLEENAALKEQVDMLQECILEMSETVYA